MRYLKPRTYKTRLPSNYYLIVKVLLLKVATLRRDGLTLNPEKVFNLTKQNNYENEQKKLTFLRLLLTLMMQR